jgi:transcriptional regulator with XRE-family HTH domain
MITPEQIRGARGLLGLTQAELAKRAGLSTTGFVNIESGQADPKVSTMKAIQRALESAGAAFENGMIGFRPFQVGDRIKYRTGRALDPMLWHAIGEIIEVESLPILQGPVPRVRARIKGIETAWTMPSEFEFADKPEPGFQTHVR